MVDDRTDAAEAAFVALLEERVEACKVKDLGRLMALYSPEIAYYDVVLPHQFVGRDAVSQNFQRWFDEYQGDIGLETHDLRVAVDGDVAFAHMLHADSGTRRAGQDLVVWLRATVCARWIDGRWQIIHEHVSFPVNPADWSAVIDAEPQVGSLGSPA
jgi:ketosteroid isomerase-like protein